MKINSTLNFKNNAYIKRGQRFVENNPITRNAFQKSGFDVFEKSQNVSFTQKCDDFHDLPEVITYETSVEYISDSIVKSAVNTKKGATRDDLRCSLLKDYACFMISLSQMVHIPLVYGENTLDDTMSYLEKAGIRTTADLLDVASEIRNIPDFNEVFDYSTLEYLKLRRMVPDKYLFSKFAKFFKAASDILSDESSEITMESVSSFLKSQGVQNEDSAFNKRFGILKGYFNDFNTYEDKCFAVLYCMLVHDDKMNMLSDLLKSRNINDDPEKIYKNFAQLLDLYYLRNKGKGFGLAGELIDTLIDSANIKKYPKSIADSKFSFSTEEGKLDFAQMLKRNNLSADQFSRLFSRPHVTEVDEKSEILYYDIMSNAISGIIDTDIKTAQEIYENFSDVIISLYKTSGNDIGIVSSFLRSAKKYQLRDSKDFYDFYKKCHERSSKNQKSNKHKSNGNKSTEIKLIEPEKLLGFVELLKFDSSDNLLEAAKLKNTVPSRILLSEKQKFEELEPIIENYILSSENSIFAGVSPFEIFSKYRNRLNVSPVKIPSVLREIENEQLEKTSEFKERQEKISAFNSFFKNDKSKLKFIENSEIDLSADFNSGYNKACLEFLSAASELLDKSGYRNFIGYLSENRFLSKSKLQPENISKLTSLANVDNGIFGLVASGRITDIKSFLDFLDEYKDEFGEFGNITAFITEMPDDMTIDNVQEKFSQLQSTFACYGLSIPINNRNISAISYDKLTKSKYTDSEFNEMILGLVEPYTKDSDVNFVSFYNGIFEKLKNNYLKTQLADEIISNADKRTSRYVNLERITHSKGAVEDYLRKSGMQVHERAKCSIIKKIPNDFMNFIRSDEWLNFKDDNTKIPDVSMHARLRLLERFVLDEYDDINNLDYDKIAEKTKDILKTIYAAKPINVKRNPETQGSLIAEYLYDGNIIKAVFAEGGKLVTIFPDETK